MNWMRFRPVYFLFSAVLIILSVYTFLQWGLVPSIDFTGGAVVEYGFSNAISVDDVRAMIPKQYKLEGVRKFKRNIFELQFRGNFAQTDANALLSSLREQTGEINLLKFETVGPAFSREILQKTYLAVVLGASGILLWIAVSFKSLEFGFFAIVALIHDLIVLLGIFSFLGHIKGVEVDILVVTAFLTVLSLSVYDTVVVYDRIRENLGKYAAYPIALIANQGISDTIVRSLNTSLTTIFVLFALFLFAGEEIRWFVLALLTGLLSGTYSSPFIAVSLLVSWREIKQKWHIG